MGYGKYKVDSERNARVSSVAAACQLIEIGT